METNSLGLHVAPHRAQAGCYKSHQQNPQQKQTTKASRTDSNTKMTWMLKLPNKVFKAAIIKVL
jgi:hypothetical protein